MSTMTRADLIVVLNTATFELVRNADGKTFKVIGVRGTRAPNALAMKSINFKPGDDPWVWPQGYAARIQQAINRDGIIA